MNAPITFSAIAAFLGKKLVGSDGVIKGYSSLSNMEPESIIFIKKFDHKYIDQINESSIVNALLTIVNSDYEGQLTCSHIISTNPRLDYIRVISYFFVEKRSPTIHKTAIIEEGAKIGLNVNIGAHCYIGKEVSIGDNTFISPNVVIDGSTIIGHDCYLKSGSVIGQTGFGFERNEEGIPEYFPHSGVIKIGNYVHIGSNNTIDRGTLGETILEDYVKTDNLVHIAHNDIIGRASLITAGVIFSGGVEVGKYSWIAPNSSIKEKIKLGNRSFIGLGAVVIQNVDDDTIVIGNPAKKLLK